MSLWSDALPILLCIVVATVILVTGVAALIRLRPGPTHRKGEGIARPSGQGFAFLSRILAVTASSAYSRDRIEERMRILTIDIAALERGAEDKASRKSAEQDLLAEDAILAAYLAEDHVGFRGGHQRKSATDDEFPERTKAALGRLEQRIRKEETP